MCDKEFSFNDHLEGRFSQRSATASMHGIVIARQCRQQVLSNSSIHQVQHSALLLSPHLLAAGSAISSGLFVPMLMLGAVIGRFMGLATVDIAQAAGKVWSPDIIGQWNWIDPGKLRAGWDTSTRGGCSA
jgi:hypothetical protein